MNQRPLGLSLKKALTGILRHKSAEGVAPITVFGDERELKLWIEYQGEADVLEISSQHILSFLSYLRTDYVPRHFAGDISHKLSPKAVYNI